MKLFGVSSTSESDYKAPDYIKEAMKKKYGEGIFVIGISSQVLNASCSMSHVLFNSGMY